MTDFVEVLVTATGRTETVPADWVGHPVLGNGLEPLPDPAVVEKLGDPPTEGDTHEVIDAFAHKAGIEFSEDVKTKAQKVALITEMLPAEAPQPEVPATNPDVQLVAGDQQTESVFPAHRVTATNETPATGDEEN